VHFSIDDKKRRIFFNTKSTYMNKTAINEEIAIRKIRRNKGVRIS